MNILEKAKKLAEFYVIRDRANEEIAKLETELSKPEKQAKQQSKTRRTHLQQPSLDILNLFGNDDVFSRPEVVELSQDHKYKYSPAAVSSTLYRLFKKGYLDYDGTFFSRSRKPLGKD